MSLSWERWARTRNTLCMSTVHTRINTLIYTFTPRSNLEQPVLSSGMFLEAGDGGGGRDNPHRHGANM